MSTVRSELLLALDALEDREARQLTWGLVDESWDKDELLETLRSVAPQADPRTLLEALEANALVSQVPRTWPPRYRTRMAETVRLLARLRQMFPGKPWQSAPRLVADYRFRHEPRRFPRRDIDAETAVADLVAAVGESISDDSQRVIGSRHLSSFQLSAARAVFEALSSRSDRGVIVGAGTGSGKTLAFYLPALVYLATRPPNPAGTGVIAIYPRNELLKDQLATALDEIRSLRQAGGRALRIGAYFGPTPMGGKTSMDGANGWRRVRSGWLCPFLTCRERIAGEVCGGDLVWAEEQQRRSVESLVCTKCQGVVRDDELVLTRQSMQSKPPDLVFTTTEMLNRSLSDGWSMHVFGCGLQASRSPALVLLDEVHTYEGVAGAQVAYLLRRWRRSVGRPMTFVGLSATLRNAQEFFAELCGLKPDFIEEVVPHPDDFIESGREYQLVLRGDPASQAALLSTSIQSLMLIRRMLNPAGEESSLGAFGSKVFAFCDNLDLVNRLYRQLLDAEGRNPFGKIDPKGFMLAGLRFPWIAEQRGESVDDWEQRDVNGQLWWFSERLGFGGKPPEIGRTSSQDSGVGRDAEVIVATASLEVGFDDPSVGAVLQHKAPRDIAQFLQRRGRAGRTQVQRPWTIVVLSDYGRDRAAYQDYESLLDPILPAKTLPLGNQSVRKMQASMCLIDWVAERLRVSGSPKLSGRRLFWDPKVPDAARKRAADLLARVIDGGEERTSLMQYVARALKLSDEETSAVCWEQPRSLLLEVVPTAYRRLESRWGRFESGVVVGQGESQPRDAPLPEFVPRSLFDDLCLPEVMILPPADYDKAADTAMPVLQALNELAPGRVTLRWAVQKVTGLWIEPSPDGVISLEERVVESSEVLGEVFDASGALLPLVRPLSMKPTRVPASVLDSSNGFLHWMFASSPTSGSEELARPRRSPLEAIIERIDVFTHAGRGALRTWRYATHGTSNVATRTERRRFTSSFSWKGEPAAIGYEALVDAMRVVVRCPPLETFQLSTDVRRLRQLRSDLFRERLVVDLERLDVDPFRAAWITDVVVSIVARRTLSGESLAELAGLSPGWWRDRANEQIDGVLLGLQANPANETPLRDLVLEAFEQDAIVLAIESTISMLQMEPDDSWTGWIRGRFLQTLAAAIQSAAQSLCPDFDVDSECAVDVEDSGNSATITLSDTSIGGGGLLETLVSRISADPRRFDSLVVAALEPSDLEEADRALPEALRLLKEDPGVAESAQLYRSNSGSRLEAWRRLTSALVSRGLSPNHATLSNLSTRVFRPGSSARTDDFLRHCVEEWDAAEEDLGFAVGQRVAAALLAERDSIRTELSTVVEGTSPGDIPWTQAVILGVLWVRAEERRASSLQASNRFVRRAPATERTLVLDALGQHELEINVDEAEWRTSLATGLGGVGRARLTSLAGSRRAISMAVVDLVAQPLELGWILVHPRVDGVTRRDGRLFVDVVLEEAPQ